MFRRIRKKGLSILLTLAMVIGPIPAMTITASAATDSWDGNNDTDWYTANPSATSFTINTAEELAGLATLVNANTDVFLGDVITLTSDLDLSGYTWMPIGQGSNGFKGTFDGGNHTISNMTIGTSSSQNSTITNGGLFGYAISPVFKNVYLKDASIYLSASGVRAGILVGNVGTSATVYNCGSSGTLACSYTSSTQRVGGLFGYLGGGTINNSFSTANCSGSSASAKVGGLVAEVATSLNISNCYAAGNVISGNIYVGGVIGYSTLTAPTSSYVYWNSDATHTTIAGTPSPKKAVGSSQTISDTSYTSDAMKLADFVELLNDHKGSYNSWAPVTGSYPTFAPVATEITGFDAIGNVSAGTAGSATYGSAAAVIGALPNNVTANTSAVTVPVTTWVDTDHYNPAVAGSYTFTATLGVIPLGFANTGNYTASVEVVVAAPADVEITGFDAIGNVSAGTAGSATYANAAAVIGALPASATANTSAVTVTVTTWVDTDHYNPAVAGSYTFTATLGTIPPGFANTGNYTASVEVVVAAPADVEITGFDAIANVNAGTAGSATYGSAAAVITALPNNVTANTSAVTVPVTTWVDIDNYNPAVAGSYTFTATLGAIPSGFANTGNYIARVEVVVAVPAATEITGFDAIANVNAGTAGSATYGSAAAVIAALPNNVTANTSAVTVPVTTWVDIDNYNPAVAGSYTFTATLGAIPSGFANTGNYTARVEVVVAVPAATEITGFDAIGNVSAGTEGSATYGSAAAVIAALPASATANTSAVTVPVTTWVDTDNYNPAVAGSYTFTATLGAIPSGFANTGNYIARVEVVVAAPSSAPSSSGSGNNGSTSNEDDKGQISMDQQQDESAPDTNLNNTTEELKGAIFTTEELSKIEAGEDAKVILKVTDISNSVSEDDKKLISEKLDGDVSARYIDLSLYIKVGDGTEKKITKTNKKISISIEVPTELRSIDMTKNRTYQIVRIHDGEVTIIEGTYDLVTGLFTFETDRFSTYVLTFEDTNTNTGENENIVAIMKDFFHLRLTAKGAETSQKLTYTKISGADGYIIYGAPCGVNNKVEKLADVSGTTKSYNHKGLNKATYYKYQVQAYKIINGKKVIIAISKVIHSVTISKTYVNPTKVVSETSALILAVGESKKVTCQVVLPGNRKIKNHTDVIRYETTNNAIAIVSRDGEIKAISKGTCYIYAYAQNGVYKKIKITIK